MSCRVLAMFVGFWCDTAGCDRKQHVRIPNPGEEEHSTFGLHVAVPRSREGLGTPQIIVYTEAERAKAEERVAEYGGTIRPLESS